MATKLTKDKTVRAACLLENSARGLIANSVDCLADTDYELSYVFGFDILRQNDPWVWRNYDWVVVDVEFSDPLKIRCVLSREGNVRLYGPGGNPDRTYELPDAGVFREGAAGYGYVNRIRAIGGSLYVCGQSRQVYRFVPGSPHVLDGQWVDFAGPMRQPPISEPPDDPEGGEAFDRWLDENDPIDLVDIAGSDEQDIYAAGDECWHYDGQQWRRLELPTDENINAIKIINPDQVVMVGHNGTLLVGNARQGFRDLSSIDDNQNITGVELFEGKLFLASNFGLFAYDLATKKIEQYVTTLTPDLQDTHTLEAKDGVLWSFGGKDLAYFDGKTWTRVDHPDNPPIR